MSKGKLRGNRAPGKVTPSSLLMTDLSAFYYQKNIPIHTKGKLVDLGCGFVPLYQTYKPYVDECVCVDWPNSWHRNTFLDIEANLNEPLPLKDSDFDTIILSEVLEHIAEPEILWKEMARILKPGGKILIGVPFLYKIHESPHDYYRYTEFSLRNFSKKNSLEIISLEGIGGIPAVLGDILAKQIIRIPLMGKWLSKAIQAISFWFINGPGKNLSKKSSVHYPISYFMVVQKPLAHA